MYRILADIVTGVHLAYVSFVVLGLLVILAGAVLKWEWIRNFWFRTVHLAMIVVVALEAMVGMQCPLTTLEHYLRGARFSSDTFVGRLLHALMFPDLPAEVFPFLYIGFALLVLGVFVLAPPRRPSWIRFPTSKLAG